MATLAENSTWLGAKIKICIIWRTEMARCGNLVTQKKFLVTFAVTSSGKGISVFVISKIVGFRRVDRPTPRSWALFLNSLETVAAGAGKFRRQSVVVNYCL